MNEKQMSTVVPNTLKVGSNALKLGAVGLAMTLVMTLAPRAYADPEPLPLSRPQLGGEAAVQSVLRYIALHSNDVAGYQAVDPAVDSVARYIAVHAASNSSGQSAEALAVIEHLKAQGVVFGSAVDSGANTSKQSGRSAEEQAVIDYLIARGVTFGQAVGIAAPTSEPKGLSAEEQAVLDYFTDHGVTFIR